MNYFGGVFLLFLSANTSSGNPTNIEPASKRIAVKVADDGVQIFGGYGYVKEYPAEKYYRDAKLCTIGEGTSEIQKIVISRSVLKHC